MLQLQKLEMQGRLVIYLLHEAGMPMIAEDMDRASWGDLGMRVMVGGCIIDYKSRSFGQEHKQEEPKVTKLVGKMGFGSRGAEVIGAVRLVQEKFQTKHSWMVLVQGTIHSASKLKQSKEDKGHWRNSGF